MIEIAQHALLARRAFLGRAASVTGLAALTSLLGRDAMAATAREPHFLGKARRVIYLHQSGGPSQLDLFDHKPALKAMHGQELPDSVRRGQRLTGMTSGQKSFPLIASKFSFRPAGQSGMMLSELLPHLGSVADDICLLRAVNTEAVNHDPAITYLQTGSQQPGRPSLGAWATYGLGSVADDLPAFVVMISHGSSMDANQGLLDRLWGSGFLPSSFQGVKLRSGTDPVLYLSDPPGIDRALRRRMLDSMGQLNRQHFARAGDPEIQTRIAQFEMAYRMQASVPELTDLSKEPESVFRFYGQDARKPGTFAANCLLARRLVERGVRFVQLYHRGWDHHGSLASNLPLQCQDTDQPSAALLADLKQRGLLDDTLVVWAGEFGRTVYGQGGLKDNYGRDHHGRCFSLWMAGGVMKPGMVYGETDDFGYNVVSDGVHIHDLNATILHCLGLNHERLTYRSQGRDFRLTDVFGEIVKPILS